VSALQISHLSPAAERQLSLSVADRVHAILSDRFVAHERLKVLLAECEALTAAPRTLRPLGLMIWGTSGAGKTTLAERLARPAVAVPISPHGVPHLPVLTLSLVNLEDSRQVIVRALRALGCPEPSFFTPTRRYDVLIELLRYADVRLLVVDVAHALNDLSAREARRALSAIVQIMDEARIPLVLLGRPDTQAVLRLAPDLAVRLDHRFLPVWEADQYLANYLDALATTFPLHKPSHLSAINIMRTLVRDSKGSLAVITDRVKFAAALAVEYGTEQITSDLLKRTGHEGPRGYLRVST
jgi:hypothetical protein